MTSTGIQASSSRRFSEWVTLVFGVSSGVSWSLIFVLSRAAGFGTGIDGKPRRYWVCTDLCETELERANTKLWLQRALLWQLSYAPTV